MGHLNNLDAVRPYTAALTAGEVDYAIGLAKELPTEIAKGIARDIWCAWKAMVAGRNLPVCLF